MVWETPRKASKSVRIFLNLGDAVAYCRLSCVSYGREVRDLDERYTSCVRILLTTSATTLGPSRRRCRNYSSPQLLVHTSTASAKLFYLHGHASIPLSVYSSWSVCARARCQLEGEGGSSVAAAASIIAHLSLPLPLLLLPSQPATSPPPPPPWTTTPLLRSVRPQRRASRAYALPQFGDRPSS